MLATILTNYLGTLFLYKFQKYKKIFLIITVLADLGFLCYFKYIDFLIESFNTIFKGHVDILHIALPLGISFYTFQAISYTVDVYHRETRPQKSLYKLALYITLFPQLIAGPIVKYHDIAEQIDSRKETLDQFYYGLRRFIIGLSRKVLIANTLGLVVDKVIGLPVEEISIWEAWLGAICYAFQIYNDFGGYTPDLKVKDIICLDKNKNKGKFGCSYYLNTQMKKEFKEYLGFLKKREMDITPDTYLFTSQKGGKPFTRESISRIFSDIYKKFNIEGSSHLGRHMFVSRLINSGVNICIVQKLANHRNISTTQRYFNYDEKMLSKAVENTVL